MALAVVVCGACALLAAPSGAGVGTLKTTWMKGYDGARDPQQARQGGGHQDRLQEGEERARDRAGYLGRRGLLRAARQVAQRTSAGMAGVGGGTPENLLEKQKELDKFKTGKVTGPEFFQYYLGYLGEQEPPKRHYQPVTPAEAVTDGGREWGMAVAVEDLHVVIEAAKKVDGKVVLAGHSLGGTVVTAYATWDFAGKPGAEGLSGLVYIDGGSSPTPISAEEAESKLSNESRPNRRGWRSVGSRRPLLGLFSMTGLGAGGVRTECGIAGAEPSRSCRRTSHATTPKAKWCTSTNEGAFGYAVNVGTSPPNLAAAQVHAGRGARRTGSR